MEKAQQAGGRRDGYLLGISAGIKASQEADESGYYKSPISAKATVSAKLSKREKIHCKKPCTFNYYYLEGRKFQYQLLQIGDNYSPLKKKDIIWFVSWTLGDLKTVLDFWKRIMSGIVSQVELIKKMHCQLWDSDQYPILFSSNQYVILCFDRVKHPRR